MDPKLFALQDATDLKGSRGRYEVRTKWFEADNALKLHQIFWLIHNCVAHPLLGAVPNEYTVQFHDLTSRWLSNYKPYKRQGFDTDPMRGRKVMHIASHVPEIPNRRAWVVHNCLAHMAIGLFPHKKTFEFHDKTAKEMNVEDWV